MRVAVPVALAALAIVVGGVLRGTDRAEALSCVGPEVVLVGAERAFIGALVAEDGDRLEFDVTEPGRGEVPDPVVVRDELADSWPLELEDGRQVGLVVREVDDELVASQCTVVDPDRLREARDGGWPTGAVTLAGGRVGVVRGVASVEVGCFGRCRGSLTLRAADGSRLGRARVDLARAGSVAVRLGPRARRRLGRTGRLAAHATVRLFIA
jgi:hypothetical protein